MQSQYERTRLAWRRTILAVIVIGGLGSVHLATAGRTAEAAVMVGLAVVAVVPAVRRLMSLRRERPLATWEPVVLTVAACLMGLSVFVPG